MKRALLVLLFVSPLFADTYIYRIGINRQSKNAINIITAEFESSSEFQPYIDTYFLTTADTNYYLLKTTPEDGRDRELEKFVAGVDLYQVQILDDGFFKTTIDNSGIYPVDKNWKVEVSSK